MGVGVADIERAIHWYQEVLGFTLLMGPMEVRVGPGYPANEERDVLGENFNAMLLAPYGFGERNRNRAFSAS